MNCQAIERIMDFADNDTKRGSQLVARVFYRTLQKRGYSENQIISVATNILSYLIESLRGDENQPGNASDCGKELHNVVISSEAKVARTHTEYVNRNNSYRSTSSLNL